MTQARFPRGLIRKKSQDLSALVSVLSKMVIESDWQALLQTSQCIALIDLTDANYSLFMLNVLSAHLISTLGILELIQETSHKPLLPSCVCQAFPCFDLSVCQSI